MGEGGGRMRRKDGGGRMGEGEERMRREDGGGRREGEEGGWGR